MQNKIKKALVICGPGMGDLITITPLLRNLKEIGYKIYLFNEFISYGNPGRVILSNLNYVGNFVEFERPIQREKKKILLFKLRTLIGSFLDVVRLISRLRKEKFDLIFDCFPGTNKTALFSFLILGKIRVGFNTKILKFLYTNIIKQKKENKVIQENSFLRKLGFRIKDKDMNLELGLQLKKNKDLNVDIKNTMCIVLGRDPDKIRLWYKNSWIALVNKLLNSYRYNLLILGAKDSITNSEELYSEFKNNKRIFNLTGKTSLNELAYILKNTRLLICVNGGIMHMASALNTPLISLSGPSYYGWNAYGKNSTNIRTNYRYKICPCNSSKCKIRGKDNHYCMKEITPEIVFQEVKKN